MIDRDQTITRLTRILDVLREDLADESNDDRRSLENTERYLSRVVDDLTDTSDVDDVVNNGLSVLLEFLFPQTPANHHTPDKCPTCEGCTLNGCIVTALDQKHACSCPPKTAPVPAQTI